MNTATTAAFIRVEETMKVISECLTAYRKNDTALFTFEGDIHTLATRESIALFLSRFIGVNVMSIAVFAPHCASEIAWTAYNADNDGPLDSIAKEEAQKEMTALEILEREG